MLDIIKLKYKSPQIISRHVAKYNDICVMLKRLGENNPNYRFFCEKIPMAEDDNLPEVPTDVEEHFIYTTLTSVFTAAYLLDLVVDPRNSQVKTKAQRIYEKTQLDSFELDEFPVKEAEFMARRQYLRSLREDYQAIINRLTSLGFHRKARNNVIRYLELARLNAECEHGIGEQHPLQADIKYCLGANDPAVFVNKVWKQRSTCYALHHFRQKWLDVAALEAKQIPADDKDARNYFLELRVQENEDLIRDLTPGAVEAFIRRHAASVKVSNAVMSGYITSIGLSSFLLSFGVLPQASIPAFGLLVVGYTVVSTYQSTSRCLANNTAILARNLFDKGLSTYTRQHWLRLALISGLTVAGCASGSYVVYLAANTEVAVATMLGSLYATSVIRGPSAWRSLERFKQRLLLANKAWRGQDVFIRKVLAYAQELFDINTNSKLGKTTKVFAAIASATLIMASALVGGKAMAEHLPNIIGLGNAGVASEFSLCLLVGALARQTIKTVRMVPYIHQRLDGYRFILEDSAKSPYKTLGQTIDKTLEYTVIYGSGASSIIILSTVALPITVPAAFVAPSLAFAGIASSAATYFVIVPGAKAAMRLLHQLTGIKLHFTSLFAKLDKPMVTAPVAELSIDDFELIPVKKQTSPPQEIQQVHPSPVFRKSEMKDEIVTVDEMEFVNIKSSFN